MHLNIKNDQVHRMARELADLTGESMTHAVTEAVRERLARERRAHGRSGIAEKLLKIGRRSAGRGIRDQRTADEIMDYDENGLPR